ncbi:MAG TPA: hypothetical protein VF956_13335 [Candidatus Dormibacteraeota bacterium]
MTYLVVAYAFAIAVLGGYLAWSLLRVRELSKPHELGGQGREFAGTPKRKQ